MAETVLSPPQEFSFSLRVAAEIPDSPFLFSLNVGFSLQRPAVRSNALFFGADVPVF